MKFLLTSPDYKDQFSFLMGTQFLINLSSQLIKRQTKRVPNQILYFRQAENKSPSFIQQRSQMFASLNQILHHCCHQ